MNTIATFSRPRQKLGLFLSVVMSMALLFTLLATSDIGRAQAQTTADSCVVPVSGDGTITGSWSSDCASEGRSGSYARFYTFTLGEPRDVAITLESQVNTYLYAREGEGTDGRIVYEDNDDDNSVFSLASSTDSGISESLGAGVYTIEATTVTPGEMGEFTLTIRGVTGAYDALFNRYDTDGDGQINKPEVIAAVRDYLGGQITKAQVVEVIRHYIIGPPTPTPEPTPDPTPTPSPTPPASDKVYTLRELAELEDEWEFSDPDISIRVQAYVYFVRDDVGDLTLWIRDAGYSEYCYFDEAHRTAVTALSEGEQVTVDGTFNGTWLRDCVLVTGSTSEPAPPPAPEPPASDKVYTLRELAELEDEREFSDPDIRIRVQAYVYFVEDDVGDLTLWIRDAGYSEYCYFDEAHRTAVTALSEGEQVTVDGTFNGTWLRDCVLVTGSTSEPAPPPAPEPPASDKVYTLRELAELEDEREFSDPDIRIRVQAYVYFVEDDVGDLTLWIRDAGYSEYCYFDEAHRTAVTALSEGEQVTVDGTFNGTWLRDCVLVTGSTSEPAPPPAPEPPASDKVYTLRELAELEDEREFSDPDIRIRVQAYVYFVEDDVGDLTLWIRDAGYSEYCYFDEAHRTAVTALSEGEQVTVDGTFNGTWLRDCVLVTGSTSEPAPPPAPEPSVTETPSPTTYRSLVITDEDRCSDYDADDYSYPQSVEADIVAGMGGIIYSPYTGEYFDSTGETDIEHIVARSEAHDSGLCDADAETRDTFASGLLNLTLAHPDLNRQEKVAKDAAEWLPEINKCWFAYRVVQVRAKYSLTVDQAEADALDAVLSECSSFEMVVVDPETEQPTPTPTAEPETTPTPEGTPEATPVATATPETDALALYDDDGNGQISCAEARAHGIAPVHSDHPAYPYMNDADGDGVVCE